MFAVIEFIWFCFRAMLKCFFVTGTAIVFVMALCWVGFQIIKAWTWLYTYPMFDFSDLPDGTGHFVLILSFVFLGLQVMNGLFKLFGKKGE